MTLPIAIENRMTRTIALLLWNTTLVAGGACNVHSFPALRHLDEECLGGCIFRSEPAVISAEWQKDGQEISKTRMLGIYLEFLS